MDMWALFTAESHLGTCGLMRSSYRDYEQFPYGTLESCSRSGLNIPKDPYSKLQEKCNKKNNTDRTLVKDCPFCKGNERRPLVNYLRKREIHKCYESIYEDEECDDIPQTRSHIIKES